MSKNLSRKGLGRGLGALLSSDSPVSDTTEAVSNNTEILLSQIEVNPFQPRKNFDAEALKELTDSIKVQGIIQPITLRKIAEDAYQIISGERRFQASKKAGLKSVPAYIREVTDQEMLEMAIIENIQRENLNAIEIAQSYNQLMTECNLKQEELSQRLGKNRSSITNYLRLLNLPSEIQEAVQQKTISMGHAKALLSLKDEKFMFVAFNSIISNELSVRQTEELVKKITSPKTNKTNKTKAEPKVSLQEFEEKLASFLNKKVTVLANKSYKGEIKIKFRSREELAEILTKMKK